MKSVFALFFSSSLTNANRCGWKGDRERERERERERDETILSYFSRPICWGRLENERKSAAIHAFPFGFRFHLLRKTVFVSRFFFFFYIFRASLAISKPDAGAGSSSWTVHTSRKLKMFWSPSLRMLNFHFNYLDACVASRNSIAFWLFLLGSTTFHYA